MDLILDLRVRIAVILFTAISISGFGQKSIEVQSPDSNLKVKLGLKNGKLLYDINYKEQIFLEESPLGLKTSSGDFEKHLEYITHTNRAIEESYEMANAKFSSKNYRANELTSTYINSSKDTLKVIFRLSNNDIAFSYQIKGGNDQTNIIIKSETTGFNLPDEATIFLSSQALPMTGWEKTKPSYEEHYLFDEPVGTPSQYGVSFTFRVFLN